MRDPYRLLGVSENAAEDEIRRSYRKLVRKHHPDLNPEDPGAEERFKELQQAYEALMSPEKHKGYGRTSRQRTGDSRSQTGRRSGGGEFSGDLSDLLRKLGYGPRNDAGKGPERSRKLQEEDVVRVLKRFGIDKDRSSKIRVSFGDAAEFSRRSGKPPIDDGLKKPPKPPKPPKW